MKINSRVVTNFSSTRRGKKKVKLRDKVLLFDVFFHFPVVLFQSSRGSNP